MKQLYKPVIEVLTQVADLINICDKETYCNPSQYAMSSVGQHVRHIIDHFIVFKNGINKQVIDYNLRSRGSTIEKDPAVGLAKISEMTEWFKTTDLEDQPINIISEVSISDTQNIKLKSSISRELIYLVNHTIHHVAYASLVVKQINNKVDNNLGIAPATATYLRSKAG